MATPLLINLLLLSILILLFSHASSLSSTTQNDLQSYVVYMGGSTGEDIEVAESTHLQLLSTVIPGEEKERISVNHVYHHAFRGFSAFLTEKEASVLRGHEKVVSVFRDPILQLHTTRSWDFLNEESGIGSKFHYPHYSSDVIIGVIDTGIWPESPSFSDKGMEKIPRRWKGVCMESFDFNTSNCNRKLIGARYYENESSPRDYLGHGTHTTSIAAGAAVRNASYYFGWAQGTAKGGSPSARIAIYKTCNKKGCDGSKMLKAFDDAAKDGVDIISASIGLNSIEQTDFINDPIAIGAFHATQKGIMVVCSAGNIGPIPSTVGNTAPWIFTVAASSIDRDFESSLILGNNAIFKGTGITWSNLTRSIKFPLVHGREVAANDSISLSEAKGCSPGSLNPKIVAGKIVVCVDNDPNITRGQRKKEAQDAGAKGLVYISDLMQGFPMLAGSFPFTHVGVKFGNQIWKYINSAKKPKATILSTNVVKRFKPAPVVADFSARGPGQLTENILKPDIMAPGVAILAAVSPKRGLSVPPGIKPSQFALQSGTSMACPHVSGAAAFIKSIHPHWTSSMIKSALMTSALTSNNMKRIVTNSSGHIVNPHEAGAGEISPLRALDPGLVFPTTTQDYLLFLCYYGYSKEEIKIISSTVFECPKVSKKTLISQINYPSISIGKLKRSHARRVTRYVHNVGSPNATYSAIVNAPKGFNVKVHPKKMKFQEGSKTTFFHVYFRGQNAKKGYNYGSVIWSDGKHNVQLVFAVNIV